MRPPADARVWFCDLDAVRPLETRRRSVLSANERARAGRLRDSRLRRRFLARCMLVRHVLGTLVGVSPEALEFETSANGRPRLVPPTLDFNLSHSENVLAVAVALDRQVGVDIEVVRPGVDVLAVAEAQFTAGELDWLRALPPGKVSGQGIASPPVAAPSSATLHSFRFRLGETDVIGALALDSRHMSDPMNS
jgi:4'-phosphopantetheinyl transferase